MQENRVLRVLQHLHEPLNFRRRRQSDGRQHNVFLRNVALVGYPAFILVPRELRTRTAKVDNGVNVVAVDQLIQSRWRELRAAVDPARLHAMEIIKKQELEDLDS